VGSQRLPSAPHHQPHCVHTLPPLRVRRPALPLFPRTGCARSGAGGGAGGLGVLAWLGDGRHARGGCVCSRNNSLFALHSRLVPQVVDYSTSKTGKHGHAKAKIVAIDIFTGRKCVAGARGRSRGVGRAVVGGGGRLGVPGCCGFPRFPTPSFSVCPPVPTCAGMRMCSPRPTTCSPPSVSRSASHHLPPPSSPPIPSAMGRC
jgi:hypothetical protein